MSVLQNLCLCVSLNKYLLGRFVISLFQYSELFRCKVFLWGVKDQVARPVWTWAKQKSQSTVATSQKNVSKLKLFFPLFLVFLLEDKGLEVFSVYFETLFFHCESEPLDFHLDLITVFVKWLWKLPGVILLLWSPNWIATTTNDIVKYNSSGILSVLWDRRQHWWISGLLLSFEGWRGQKVL